MKAGYQNKPSSPKPHHRGLSLMWDWMKSGEGKDAVVTGTVMLTIVLLMYTAVSKVLGYKIFVFQMQLAPLPFMSTLAPTLGWAIPIAELVSVALLYWKKTRYLGLICSLVLMITFEVYITVMMIMELKMGMQLPCTCGGIVSNMGWTTHLLFNALFIFLLGLSLYFAREVQNQNLLKNS